MLKAICADNPPVTYSVQWRIKPGLEAQFEPLLSQMIHAAMSFEGHLGVNVLHPEDLLNPEYWIIVKFDSLKNMRRWQTSEIRQHWLTQIVPLEQESPATQVLTGLETWFALPQTSTALVPARYKMVTVTWLAVFPLITTMQMVLGPIFLNSLPLPLRSFILTSILVPLMTYGVMPRMTQLFAHWLYPSLKHSRKR
jgi:uncharacterized protein